MPKVVDREERRREVLEATWDVIDRQGLEGATFREIAAELDSSTGTLSHYFRDKDDVLLSALRYCAELAGERILAALHELDGVAALRAVLLEALPADAQRRREWAVWIAFWARGLNLPEYRQEHRQRYLEWQLALELAVQAARDAGDLRPDLDIAEAAVRLIALIDGLGVRAMLDPDGFPAGRLERFVDAEIAELR